MFQPDVKKLIARMDSGFDFSKVTRSLLTVAPSNDNPHLSALIPDITVTEARSIVRKMEKLAYGTRSYRKRTLSQGGKQLGEVSRVELQRRSAQLYEVARTNYANRRFSRAASFQSHASELSEADRKTVGL
jgi:hypothetical protein